MFTFLIVVIALLGLVMTLLVLVQAGKGGGLAGIAAGGSATQILGARQAPDVLEKATWTLATLFLVLCILTNFTIDTGETQESVIQQEAQQGPAQGTQPLAPLPEDAQPQQQPVPAPENLPDDGNE